MGSFFKSKTTVTKSPFETNPWEPQQDYLKTGFSQGGAALDKGLGVENGVAGMTQGQLGAIDSLTNTGMNTAGNVSQAAINAGMGSLGNVSQMGQNAQGIYDFANQNRTGDVIASGGQFANDPYLQGQIDSALGDVRKAFDRDVGNINAGAVGAGGINSTRAGTLEAYALDDAMDRGAAISSQMRGNAYQSGLDRAMAMDGARVGDMIGANAQLGSSGALGLDFATRGLDTAYGGAGQALGAQSMLQGQSQNEIDMQRMGDLDLVQKYMGIVGGTHGQEGFTSSVSKSPSPFQQLVGGAASLAGAGFKLPFTCWVAREVYGVDNPSWVMFRDWMLNDGPKWFRWLYIKHGEGFAGVVRRFPFLKKIIRPAMDWAIGR